MSRISSIGKEDVHRITSGQVIVDLSTAVKELVENSLDANSKKIEVTFKNYGIDSIEVSDDGDGIDENDFDKIALKHYTSKLTTFEDVAKVKTLGFRGEAMSSLCAISNVKIITTKKAPKATTLEFKHSGELNKKTVCSRSKGTSIVITDLFNNLPVRRKDFIKNSKREFSKCLTLLQSYALVAINVKVLVYNLTPKGKKNSVLRSEGNDSMKNNILNVFGSNGLYGLIPIELNLDLNDHKSRLKVIDHSADYSIKVSGYISKCSFGFGRSATDRQLFFINNRPVTLQPFTKAINEIYKSFNHIQYPVIILNLELDPQFLDVNVTPDKRTVLIHNELHVLEKLRESLIEFYDSQDLSLTKNTQTQRSLNDLRNPSSRVDDEDVDDDDIPAQSSLNTSSFSYASNDKLEAIPSDTHETNSYRKRKDDFTSSPQKRIKMENLEEKELHDDSELSEGSISNDVGDDESELAEDYTNQHHNDHAPFDKNEEQDQEYRVEDSEVDEQEPLKHQPTTNNTGETIRSSSRDRPPVSVGKNGAPILTNLSSFKNHDSSTQPQKKQVTMEPVLMKIGNKEIVQEAYIKNSGRLAFKECHCGSHDHTNEMHENIVEQDEVEQDQDSEVIYEGEGENPEEGNIYTDEKVNSPDDLVNDETGKRKQILVDDINEPFDSAFIKKEFRNKFLTSNERQQDFVRNYELCLKFTGCFNTINMSYDKSESALKNVSIDNIADQEESENKLTLSVSKKDFMKMKIIGQFNLGFILVIRQTETSQDLFIVDQHASDEKFNFETLQKITVFDSQPLVAPKFVDLNALDELIVMDNKEVFAKNGFKFTIDEEGEPGARIQLVSLPISKKTVFDESDFNELIHLVKENQGSTDSIRCSKIRSMFAMRACRKSIMVGKSLTIRAMTKVVRNLGELDKPWVSIFKMKLLKYLLTH